MTPAEQGQDPKLRASTQDVSDRQTEAGAAHELEQIRFDLGLMGPRPGDTREHVQTALRELEMCQRYFPFAQRSRAHYKRRYEEAVKREKALVEALRRICEALDGDLMHDDPIGEADDIARSALESRSEAMGPNDGVNPGCEECGGTGFIKVPDVDDLTDDDNCPCWMGRCNCASCQARAALDQSGKERVEDRRAVVIKLTPLEAKIAQERLALLVRAEPHLRYLNDLLREAVPADQSGKP